MSEEKTDYTEITNTVKLALGYDEGDYDELVKINIKACLADLGIAGVTTATLSDPLIVRAIITFCMKEMGNPDVNTYDRMSRSYDEQKAQLATHTGHTTWSTTA